MSHDLNRKNDQDARIVKIAPKGLFVKNLTVLKYYEFEKLHPTLPYLHQNPFPMTSCAALCLRNDDLLCITTTHQPLSSSSSWAELSYGAEPGIGCCWSTITMTDDGRTVKCGHISILSRSTFHVSRVPSQGRWGDQGTIRHCCNAPVHLHFLGVFFSFTLAGGMSMVVDRSIPSHLLLRMEGKKKN